MRNRKHSVCKHLIPVLIMQQARKPHVSHAELAGAITTL
jgi:hypothetical protein